MAVAGQVLQQLTLLTETHNHIIKHHKAAPHPVMAFHSTIGLLLAFKQHSFFVG